MGRDSIEDVSPRTPRRSNSTRFRRKQRTLDRQIALYERVRELRAEGLSYGQIISEVQRGFAIRLTKSCVAYWAKDQHNPLGRAHAFLPTPTPDLAYVIGVKFGDGCVTDRMSNYLYKVRLQAKDREFVEEFDRCVSEILQIPRHRLWQGAGRPEFIVEIGSYLLARFLRKPLTQLRHFIEFDSRCSAAFLRGFFDSEGSVSKRKAVTAYNTKLDTLRYVQWLLRREFGIETTGPHLTSRKGSQIFRRGRIYFRNSDCFKIYIRMKSQRSFAKQIGFTIVRKRERLQIDVS